MKKKILAMAAIAVAVATSGKLGDEKISAIAKELRLDKKSVCEIAEEVAMAQHFAEEDMLLADNESKNNS